MNKKVLYVSALVALSMGMTSCIDNEEPESVANLRNAKAEEIIANAHKVEMDALYRKAEAAKQEFLAAEEEVALETKKIALAKEQGLAAEDLAASLADKKATTAAKQAALETALANLDKATKQAKKDMADNALIYGNGLYNALYGTDGAYTKLVAAKKDVIEKETAVAKAEIDLADAKIAPEDESNVVISEKLAYKKISLAAAEKAFADFKAAGKNIEALAKRYDEIETKLQSLNAEINILQAKYDIENSKGTDADESLKGKLTDQMTEIGKSMSALSSEMTAYDNYLSYYVDYNDLTAANFEYAIADFQMSAIDPLKVEIAKIENGEWTSVDIAENDLAKAKVDLDEAKAKAAQAEANYNTIVAAYK